MNANNKRILIILGIIIVVIAILFGITVFMDSRPKQEFEPPKEEIKPNDIIEEKPKKELQIVDINSNSRPYAVMINNHPDARWVQFGLQDAYLIYEMNVEYGLTRLMALYKDKNTSRIGSIRSSRHTFLDYVMENDAIYIHFGWSYIAEEQVPKLGINNLNGLYDSFFWRDTSLNVAWEHTAFSSMEKIKQNVQSKGYKLTTDKELLLNYSAEKISLDKFNQKASNVKLSFSQYTINDFKYDSNNQVYKRIVNGQEILDYVTKKPLTVKNIIAIKVNNWTLSGTTLQDFANIGIGDGFYITEGKAIPIKWEKPSRSSQTIYKDLEDNEIVVNDGNTYIGIVPLGNTITFY